MRARGIRLEQGLGALERRAGAPVRQRPLVASPQQVQQLVQEPDDRLLILGRAQPRPRREVGLAVGRDREDALGRQAVRHVHLELDDVGAVGRDRALEGALDAVGGVGAGGPEVEALDALREDAAPLAVVEIDVRGGGAERVVHGDVGGGGEVEVDVEDGVVLDADAERGRLDPVAARRKRDAGRAVGDDLQLRERADAAVEEHARRRHGAGRQHDLAAGRQRDDGMRAVGVFDLDAGGGAAGADDADGLGVQLQREVGEALRQREVGPDGAGAEGVLDVEGRVGVDLQIL